MTQEEERRLTLKASAALKAADYWTGQVHKANSAMALWDTKKELAELERDCQIDEWRECLRLLQAEKEEKIGASGDV